ncbi:hypothetical protein AB0467_29495 [Streptomyces sp. NPDC052095]|uniref:hypothetical protein n=1 Tax=unclassified Streptomyces TaxID=2593676 RepID=UPI00344E5220
MSQSVPPPQQPHDAQPGGGNPFAGQQGQPGQPPAAPSGNPFAGGQQGAPFGGAPYAPPPAPVRENLGLGLAAAVVAAVVAGALYGVLIGTIEREIGYAAVGVGFLVGFAAGKVGGRNPVLPVVSAVLSLVAVYFGQLLGEAMIAAKQLPVTVSEMFFDHFSLLNEAWKADSNFLTYLFFVIAAVAAFSGSKKAAA